MVLRVLNVMSTVTTGVVVMLRSPVMEHVCVIVHLRVSPVMGAMMITTSQPLVLVLNVPSACMVLVTMAQAMVHVPAMKDGVEYTAVNAVMASSGVNVKNVLIVEKADVMMVLLEQVHANVLWALMLRLTAFLVQMTTSVLKALACPVLSVMKVLVM
jgi:hypothetical protein